MINSRVWVICLFDYRPFENIQGLTPFPPQVLTSLCPLPAPSILTLVLGYGLKKFCKETYSLKILGVTPKISY